MLKFKILLFGQRLIERGAWFLAPLSWVWGVASYLKNALYDHSLLPIAKVNRPIVSIGNLVAGGTGKTPLVHLIASQFPHRNVAILSRGYGPFPDEPMLLQRRLPKVKVYIGKNRAYLAKCAMEDGAQLLILDDGFQYRKLHRDFDVLILSGADPFGKGHYLPWGFLRDSPARLRCADAVFVSGATTLDHPHISLKVEVERILDAQEKQIPSIRGCPVALFCAIAKPAAFKKTVVDLGALVVSEWTLADHAPVPFAQLMSFAKKSKSLGAKAIVCTEKDFVKFYGEVRCALPLYFLEISLRVVEGRQKWENLIVKIDQKIDNIGSYER